MKVKDLVKGKTYEVFNQRSSFFSSGKYTDFDFWFTDFVPASYIGCIDRRHFFIDFNNFCYFFTYREIHGGSVVERV